MSIIRTTTRSGRYVVSVIPPSRRKSWDLEHRAVMSGYIAVIDGKVIEPGSNEANTYRRQHARSGDE